MFNFYFVTPFIKLVFGLVRALEDGKITRDEAVKIFTDLVDAYLKIKSQKK